MMYNDDDDALMKNKVKVKIKKIAKNTGFPTASSSFIISTITFVRLFVNNFVLLEIFIYIQLAKIERQSNTQETYISIYYHLYQYIKELKKYTKPNYILVYNPIIIS